MTKILIALFAIATLLLAGCASLLPATEEPVQPGAPADPTMAAAPTQAGSDASGSGGKIFPGSSQKSPLDPIENEASMTRGSVVIDSSDVVLLESQPMQIMLHMKGNLPTPCHKLRAKLSEPDAENKINVEVYSLSDPDEICIQVLQDFETNIPLGSYAAGAYKVLVNGEKVGEFTQ